MAKTDDPLVDELTEALTQRRLAFLVGAGISVGRQSHLPGWAALIEEVLLAIAGEDGKEDVPQVLVHQGQLLNEVLLQLVSGITSRHWTDELIRRSMTSGSYSAAHRFLWWTIRNFEAVVATPNYDELIEEAGRDDPDAPKLLRERLVKLHGSVSDLTLARYTSDSVYRPLEPTVRRRLLEGIDNKVLVVAGYRGADQYDIMPVVFREAAPRKVVWLVHEELDNQVRADFLTPSAFPVTIEPRFESDALFRAVYGLATSPGSSDPELDRWHASVSGYPGQWKYQVRVWGAQLWADDPHGVQFLWARILDYVRVYEDVRRNIRPAEAAYLRLLGGGAASNAARQIEAKARLAYVRRTTNRGSFQEFRQVLGEIEEARRRRRPGSTEVNALDRLAGLVSHQFGVLLQNRAFWHQARVLFKEAETVRERTGDPELHHSVFLQFMNAYQAYRAGAATVDELAPDAWRTTLVPRLESMANELEREYNPEQHGQVIHNIAFVHQALAEESWDNGNHGEARTEWDIALRIYLRARGIRLSLRDPRMAAQSEVRIAQCKIGLARVACKTGDAETVAATISEAEDLSDSVEQRYRSMPQEPLRLRDVERIRKDAADLRRQCVEK